MHSIWSALVVQKIALLQVAIVFESGNRGLTSAQNADPSGFSGRKFGDPCDNGFNHCEFEGSFCDYGTRRCRCADEFTVTNHINKCGKPAAVNGTCSFTEECEAFLEETECRDGVCICRFEKVPVFRKDGKVECIAENSSVETPRYIDPTMIGILVAMVLMFIIICIVMRLFSKARFRENRTIFNTPNPRLMNASLLKPDNKHHERRDSKSSIKGPSRQASLMSLKAHPPGSHELRKDSANDSGSSTPTVRSPKHLPKDHGVHQHQAEDV